MSANPQYNTYDQAALEFMRSRFPDYYLIKEKRRYYGTCPECGAKKKGYYNAGLPHNGGCMACGYRHKGVFDLGYRSELKRVERDNLTPIERAVMSYRRESEKSYRLTEDVIREFNLQIVTRERKDKRGWYDVLAIPSDDILGYTKYLNYSGRWISVNSADREPGNKWLNLHKLKRDESDDTIYFLAGEWDLFSFWKHTGIHGISPIDGEGTPATFSREQFNFISNRHVVIFWDNDAAGYKGGRALAQTMKRHHKLKSLKVVDLSRLGLSGGQDIDDFFSTGGTKDRLFEEIEKTPDFSGSAVDSNPELARIKNPNPIPNYPDSVVDSETLSALWNMAIESAARKDDLLRELAESKGIGRKDQPDEIRKYRHEIDTLIYKAFDTEIKNAVELLHIKQVAKNSELEDARYYYYQESEGIYKYLTDDDILFIANEIAHRLTSPDNRRTLDEFRRLAAKDFKVAIKDAPIVDFNNLPVNYINFANGTFSLQENRLHGYSPAYLLRYRLQSNYNPKSRCHNFDRALNMSFSNRAERREMLKVLYYIISGIRNKEISFWFYGGGLNGKSVFANLCRLLVGESRTSALPFENIDSPHGTASLLNSLLNIVDEVPKNYKMPDALFKRITGNSLMYINPKNKAGFGFFCKAVFVVTLNELTYSSDTTFGFKRRFKFLKFKRLNQKDVNENFIKVLESELDGITYKLLTRGRVLFEKEGFLETASSQEVKEEMANKNSVTAYWSGVFTQALVKASEIYNEYLPKFLDAGHTPDVAKRMANDEAGKIWRHESSDLDTIDSHTIIQKYHHKIKGDILLINTNKHYAIYRDYLKHDETKPVSQANFRKGSSDFILDKMKNHFADTTGIDITKNDALNPAANKRNITLLMLKRMEQ